MNLLEKDRKALLDTTAQVYSCLSEHRDSSQHEQKLLDIVTHIKQSVEDQIANTLPDLLQSLDVRTFDDATLIEVRDTAENTLLLRLESAIRRRLETEMEEQFARYYTGLFVNEIQRGQVYNQLNTKMYGQTYITEGLNPVNDLEHVQNRICEDYIAACRQILIYELIQMPIIESLRRVESKTWKVVKASGVFDSGDSSSTDYSSARLSSKNSPPNLFSRERRTQVQDIAKKVIGETFGVGQGEVEQDDLSAEKLRDKYFLDNLREALGEGNMQPNTDRISHILISQFEQRIDNALKKSLPHLESVFFYALGSFRKRFDEITSEMKQAHMLRVNDPNASIKNILLEQDSVTILRLTRAAALLSELEQLRATS